MTPAPTPEPVRREELGAAFRLLFQHADPAEREARTVNALRLVRRGELDPHGLFVVRGRRGLLGAVFCLPMPGAGALVWPPQCVLSPRRDAMEDDLLRHAADWLRARQIKVAQALLTADEARFADALPRNGFAHVAALWFLRHDLSVPPRPDAPVRLDYRPYDPANSTLFHQTLRRTYDGTLDCPELNGARDVEDVVTGHRPPGKFDPDLWSLALADGVPVGVLMLTEAPDTRDWEVSYVGVVPEARRQGFGRELMFRAFSAACAAGAPSLGLSVDGRNRPAWDLYLDLGFKPYDCREVFLAVWK